MIDSDDNARADSAAIDERSDTSGPGEDRPGQEDVSVREARRILMSAERIVVLTGAGISTDAGIPDFRGPDGLWTKNPAAERASTIQHYLTDDEARRASWRMRLDTRLVNAEPTPGHHALVDLEGQGRLGHLATQNVDGLHRKAGTSAELLTEVHGSVSGIMCVSCDWRSEVAPVLDRVRAGDDDPRCDLCGGILKTTVVMFGEMLPEGAMEECIAAVDAADAFLAVGTTLEVGPVNSMAFRARSRGLPVVIVNKGDTAGDTFADAKVEESISEVLPKLLSS